MWPKASAWPRQRQIRQALGESGDANAGVGALREVPLVHLLNENAQ